MGGAYLEMPGGGRAHIRGAVKACAVCHFLAGYQCDYPMGRGKTCDAYLCEKHAIVQGRRPESAPRLSFMADEDVPEELLHFCPTHHLMAWRK